MTYSSSSQFRELSCQDWQKELKEKDHLVNVMMMNTVCLVNGKICFSSMLVSGSHLWKGLLFFNCALRIGAFQIKNNFGWCKLFILMAMVMDWLLNPQHGFPTHQPSWSTGTNKLKEGRIYCCISILLYESNQLKRVNGGPSPSWPVLGLLLQFSALGSNGDGD